MEQQPEASTSAHGNKKIHFTLNDSSISFLALYLLMSIVLERPDGRMFILRNISIALRFSTQSQHFLGWCVLWGARSRDARCDSAKDERRFLIYSQFSVKLAISAYIRTAMSRVCCCWIHLLLVTTRTEHRRQIAAAPAYSGKKSITI